MINGIRLKVCGLTSLTDAVMAANNGADHLGFIFYPKSPRYLSPVSYAAISSHLPMKSKVAVMVEPAAGELEEIKSLKFDFYQIHFAPGTPLGAVEQWSQAVGPERLWLAPKLPPGGDVDIALHALAGTLLFDTYRPGAYGGTGQTGDWPAFRRLSKEHPRMNWILAGGLGPDNVLAALAESGARFIDVNSGVESVPGIKSAEKIKRLCEALTGYKGAITRAPFPG